MSRQRDIAFVILKSIQIEVSGGYCFVIFLEVEIDVLKFVTVII